MGEGKKVPLPKICHTYPNDETWHSHTLITFLTEINKFCYIKKCRYRFHLGKSFLILPTFESLRVVLIKTVTILTMPANMATLGYLKIKVFWKKCYDVIISVHNVTKILSRDSNYHVNVVMWQKCGDPSISVREVIIISIL